MSEMHRELIEIVQLFEDYDLSVGTSGNASIRMPEGFLITPSARPYNELEIGDLAHCDWQGSLISGKRNPSSEWHIHSAIYQTRQEVGGIVHVHSPYSTAIACTREGIPSFHYMVAIAGGTDIRCANYATFGTPELAENTVQALSGRTACLLANHGVIAIGADLAEAFDLTLEV
ncbi:MAG: class II aldolase/adducin family protein, partial [Candidatus Eutrophobiaceae bacterium]